MKYFGNCPFYCSSVCNPIINQSNPMKIKSLLILAMMAMPAVASAQVLAEANFSTYQQGVELVGQNGWVQNGTTATGPLFVSNGVVAMPGGIATNNQDAYLPFTQTILPPTEGMTILHFEGQINVTSAGAAPSYFVALRGGTFDNARIAAKVNAAGTGYTLGVRVTGQSGFPFVYGTQEFTYGEQTYFRAVVFMVPGAQNDVIDLYAGTSPTNMTLQSSSVYTTGSGTDPGDYNAIVISQFGSATVNQSGVAISNLKASIHTPTSIENGNQTVKSFNLEQNYPNPFNPSTVVGFQLSVAGQATLKVYDLLGREVAVLVNGALPAGAHSVTFDAAGLPSGVYMYKLEAGGQSMTRRMTLVK